MAYPRMRCQSWVAKAEERYPSRKRDVPATLVFLRPNLTTERAPNGAGKRYHSAWIFRSCFIIQNTNPGYLSIKSSCLDRLLNRKLTCIEFHSTLWPPLWLFPVIQFTTSGSMFVAYFVGTVMSTFLAGQIDLVVLHENHYENKRWSLIKSCAFGFTTQVCFCYLRSWRWTFILCRYFCSIHVA